MRGLAVGFAAVAAVLWASAAGAADEEAKPRIALLVGGPAVDKSIDATGEVLRRRLDTLSLEPKVMSGGGGLRIEIDQPDDMDAVSTVVTTPGVFAIHAAGEIVQECPAEVQAGMVCMPTIEPRAPFVVVSADPVLSGDILDKAVPITGEGVVPQVAIQMNRPASDVFAQFTKAISGGRIAFAVDGVIITAPTIRGQITSGAGVLAGPGIPAPTWAAILTHPPLPGALEIQSIEAVPAQ